MSTRKPPRIQIEAGRVDVGRRPTPAKAVEPRPITVRLDAAAFAELEARTGDERGEGLPTVAQVAIGRYLEVCRREVPRDLSEGEWNLIRDSLNGVWLQEEMGGPSSIAVIQAQIDDSMTLNGAARKWKVDGEVLLGKIAKWSYAQKVAVVDAVERWWREQD